MQWSDFFTALGLAAVIEGVLYAVAPESTKQAMTEFMALSTEHRRKIALCIAAAGVFVVWIVRG